MFNASLFCLQVILLVFAIFQLVKSFPTYDDLEEAASEHGSLSTLLLL